MMMTTMTREEEDTTSGATAKEDMVRARIIQVTLVVEIIGTETVLEGKPLDWYMPQ